MVKGTDLIISECGCNYDVHKDCMMDWLNKKNGDPACITCNSVAFLREELELEDRAARIALNAELNQALDNERKRLFYKMFVIIICGIIIIYLFSSLILWD